MLTAETISRLKIKLLTEKARLESAIEDLKKIDHVAGANRREEEVEEDEEIEINSGVAADLAARLNNIDSALRKISNGNYGICENCGREIELELLEIDPESRLCKLCKH
jgi:RNA polymerase-binding transcription factor DksA